jgi:DNA-binding MarR family transcriptional regulator
MHSILNSFSREVSRFFDDYFKEYQLATPYVELILLVYQNEKISQKKLGEEMNLAPSTITRFVDKLVKRGLFKKSKNGRLARISLSADGKKLVPYLSKGYEEALADLQKKLGEKYVHTTGQLLKHGADLMKA